MTGLRRAIARLVWWLWEPAMIERANEEVRRQDEEQSAARQVILDELARRNDVQVNGVVQCAWPLDQEGRIRDRGKLH